MDPGLIPGAVAPLGEDKRDLRLPQNLLIRFRDESPVEDESCPGGIDLGDIPDRAWQAPGHHRKSCIGRTDHRKDSLL